MHLVSVYNKNQGPSDAFNSWVVPGTDYLMFGFQGSSSRTLPMAGRGKK